MSKVSDAQIELSEASNGDECPLCHSGTVEIVNHKVRCRGECGAVVGERPALNAHYDFAIAFQSALDGYCQDRRKRDRRK